MNVQPHELPHIFLKPGELCVSEKPARVTTILGSCIAITMFDAAQGVAAICHAVHPCCRHQATCADACRKQLAYVPCVIPRMITLLRDFDVAAAGLEIKLFGGAAILTAEDDTGSGHSIGRRNVTVALDALHGLGLRLKIVESGGQYGRKLIFDTATGDVWVRPLLGGLEAIRQRDRKLLQDASLNRGKTPIIMAYDLNPAGIQPPRNSASAKI